MTIPNDFIKGVYLDEIVRQCRYVERSWNALNQALRDKDQDGIWMSLQSLMVAAANVSKLLDPNTGDKYKRDRGNLLSSDLNVTASNKIRERKLRNHIEHFDERLDNWATNDGSFFGSFFVGGDRLAVIDGQPAPVHHRYDPSTTTYWFLQDSIEIGNLVEECRLISKSAINAKSRLSPPLP